jgi:hypothetical protein
MLVVTSKHGPLKSVLNRSFRLELRSRGAWKEAWVQTEAPNAVSCCLLVANKLVGRCRPRSQKREACLSCPTDLRVAFSDLSVKKEKPAHCGGFWIEGGKLESKERNKTFKSMCRFHL